MIINQPGIPIHMLCDDGSVIRCKPIALGIWNMQTTASIVVNHGLAALFSRFIHVSAVIRDDPGTSYYPLEFDPFSVSFVPSGSVIGWDSTSISLARLTAGPFDNAIFSNGVINRGTLFVWYRE